MRPAAASIVMVIVMVNGLSGVPAVGQVASGDFNGDNRDDLVVGVPDEDVGALADAGAVHVLYGKSVGLRSLNSQVWTQDSLDVPGTCAANDRFGAALAAGDFDNDGFDDLAIGIPGEWVGVVQSVGAITIMYGTAQGLSAAGSELFHRSSPGVSGVTEMLVNFGSSLACGDFNNDGFDDLAIGVPNDTVTSHDEAGSVHIFYGSSGGLTPSADRILSQDESAVADSAEANDNFGAALASGDFNRDGYDDLVVSVPSERLPGAARAGAVHVFRGSTTGIQAIGSQLWHENSAGIPDVAESNDLFGQAIAVGDFDNDHFDDLAIGVPGEDVGGVASAGLVHILYGSSNGLTGARDQMWHQGSPSIGEVADDSSKFGRSLAAGDFNDDGFDDLAVGIPLATASANAQAGVVFVLRGSATGLRGNGHQRWDQDAAVAGDASQAGAQFGENFAVADFDHDRFVDLAIAAPFHDVNAVVDAGAVTVLYGSASHLSATDSQLWHQDQAGIDDVCEQEDSLGGTAVD